MSFDNDQILSERYRDILAPIRGNSPVGINVRNTIGFNWLGLKEARRGDRAGCLVPASAEVEEPDWDKVNALATQALKKFTKDLQIAMWLVQPMTLTVGFEGLYEGLFVVRELIRRYWKEGLYPNMEDSDGLEGDERVLLLEWFDNELATWINLIPLTPEIHGTRYSLGDYRLATLNLNTKNSPYSHWQERAPNHELLLEIRRALNGVGHHFLTDLSDRIRHVQRQIASLELCLATLNESIVFRSANRSLDLCISLLAEERVAKSSEIKPVHAVLVEQPVHPETIQDPWERALAWIRLERFEMASHIVESTFIAAQSERDRFFRKFELARTLFEIKRYDLAINILQPLSEQIEQFNLAEWEAPNFVGSLWQLLYNCYQNSGKHAEKARELESQLCRTTPWITLRGLLKQA